MGKILCAGKAMGPLSETPRQLEVTLRRRLTRPCPFIFGWLVGCFGFNDPLRQYFSLYRAVSQKERKKTDRGDRKCPKQPSPALTTRAIGPRPYPYAN